MNARERRRKNQERLNQLFIGCYIEMPLLEGKRLRVPPGGPLQPRRIRSVLAHFWIHAAIAELQNKQPRARYLTRFIGRAREHFLAALPEDVDMQQLEAHLLHHAHEQLHALEDDGEPEPLVKDSGLYAAFAMVELGRILAETPHHQLLKAAELGLKARAQ